MNDTAITLSVPPRTLKGVTFTDGTLEDLEDWVAALPAAPEEAAKRLRNGLMELNRAEGYFTARFPELELLRPVVRRLCRHLVATGELQRLAQALQTELATGYKIAVVETLEERVPLEAGSPADSPTGMAIASIHRALSECSDLLLRALRHDTHAPAELWEEASQLFLLAESTGVLEEPVRDTEHRWHTHTRVVDAWLRLILLGTSDPHALRRAQLGSLHAVLEDWTRFVDVRREAPDTHASAVVDVEGDDPPVRGALHDGEEDATLRWLDGGRLMAALKHAVAGRTKETDGLLMPESGGADLAQYALRIWGDEAERGADRLASGGELELCVGMSAVHRQLRGAAAPPGSPTEVHRFTISDASPGGFGLETREPMSERLQTGELVALRRPGAPQWQLAVARWRAAGSNVSRLGVELLSPRAEAAAARHEDEMDDATIKWTPVLLLPEIAALKRPAALIVPRGRFVGGATLSLKRSTGAADVKLGRSRSFAESYEEFSFT